MTRSELVEDLQADTDGFGTVIVRKSKTDQTGKGAAVAITADAMHHDVAQISVHSTRVGACQDMATAARRLGARVTPP